jgi:hypothetical protein
MKSKTLASVSFVLLPPTLEVNGMTTTIETTVKEHPILFSGPMVRAILEGRKTQTRRVVKPQPSDDWMNGTNWQEYYKPGKHQVLEKNLWVENHETGKEIPCRYGKPGDRLWVRETFNVEPMITDEDFYNTYLKPIYRADDKWKIIPKWKPSIFMPRWASRITLEITDVRVERLQDISYADVLAEGTPTLIGFNSPRKFQFEQLWESINGKKYPWSSNPWVWVVEFKRVEVSK